MFARSGFLSLALALVANQTAALDLDVNSKDSIKSVAKSLASSIASIHKENLNNDRDPGLFGPPYYWWQAGSTFTELIEYSWLTGDSQFDDTVSAALQYQLGDFNAFMPPNQTKTLGNEDQAFWGLASLTAHEAGLSKPKEGEWIDYAVNVWNTQVLRWDEKSCDGGLRWQIFTFNNGYDYKNSASNGNFFLLSARLASLTKNSTYSDWASKSYDWSKKVGLLSEKFQVFDGTDVKKNCSSINHLQWTYTQAMYIEGSALMYNITNASETWADATRGYMNASSVFVKNGVLSEVACENNGKCSTDNRAFKGIAIRSLARAALVAPFISDSVHTLLEASAKAAARTCVTDEKSMNCQLRWQDPETDTLHVDGPSSSYLGEITNALSAVKALLWSDAKPALPGNATSPSGSPSSTLGAGVPQNTSSAGTIAASLVTVSIVAFAAALSC